MTKFCSECGKAISDENMKFCPDCGEKLPKQKSEQKIDKIAEKNEPLVDKPTPRVSIKTFWIIALIMISIILYPFSWFFIPYGESMFIIKSSGILGSAAVSLPYIGYFCLAVGWICKNFWIFAAIIIIGLLLSSFGDKKEDN
jgi:DNA-directed RNA polymerase subunit RPC12/RpoP